MPGSSAVFFELLDGVAFDPVFGRGDYFSAIGFF